MDKLCQGISLQQQENITKDIVSGTGQILSGCLSQLQVVMNKLVRFSILGVLILGCSGWGYLVHRTVNQLAIYQLPKNIRPFFFLSKDSLARNAPRPDMRRATDPSEATKHFIDLEAYGDSAAWKMPLHWQDAVIKYSRDTLLKYGYVPYQIISIKDKLAAAFKRLDRDSILFYATDLGHYIGDAHVPLHTALNYDGQFTNQRGIHDLWETSVPEASLDQYKLHNRHQAVYLSNPEEAIWQTIRESHNLLENMLATEKEISKRFTDSSKYITRFRWGKERKFYSPAFTKAYNLVLGESINLQLLHSANQIADFWYTAWVDGGRPELSGLMKEGWNRAERKSMKKEVRDYRKGS